MSTSQNKQDIDQMFLKMGEKLGWFKNNDGNSDQTLLPHNTGIITPKKIKQENIVDSKSTDGKRRNKLKLRKKTVKSELESAGKSISSHSRSCNITKPQSFQALLSSDSEEEQDVAMPNAEVVHNPTAVLCSDSDDDNSQPRNRKINNTVTCVGESFIAPPLKSLSQYSDNYNNSVIQKRVSIASCTLDIDDLGEPLVESTRIHRRSSVTYRQVFEGIEEPDISYEHVNDSVLVCDDTKFVTAIENFESLRLSPDLPTKQEHLSDHEGDTKGMNAENDFEYENMATGHDLHGNKSYEEVEVVDVGTQTDDSTDVDDGIFTTATIRETSNIYGQETVLDDTRCHVEPPPVNGLYREMTVDDIADVNCNKTDSYSDNTEVVSNINNYLGITENSVEEMDNKEKGIYEDETEITDDLHAFNELTDDGISSDVKRDIYQEDTVDVSSSLPGSLIGSVKDSDQSDDEIFHDVENLSEASEYEVNDVGTQTDETHIVLDNSLSKEYVTTGDVINDHTESGVDGKHLNDTSEKNSDQDSADEDDKDPDDHREDNEDYSLNEESSKSDKSFHEIAASVKQVMDDRFDDNKNIPEQSWRSRKYSDSSDSDALESFFQRMRKPEPIKSSSESPESPLSMDDFIVEDDDMTSESDDSVFYLRETQEMNKSHDYVPSHSSSSDVESSEEDEEKNGTSSSEDNRHTKHRHKDNENKSSKVSFSSDEESDVADNLPSIQKPKANEVNPDNNHMRKKSNALVRSRIDYEISSDSDSDSDQEVFPEVVSIVKPNHEDMRGRVSHKSKESVNDSGQTINESELFKTPNPIRKKKSYTDKENLFKTPTSVKKSNSVSSKGYISLSDETDSDSTDFVVTPSPRNVKSTPNITMGILTPVSDGNRKFDSHSTPVTPKCSFLKSLSSGIDEDRRHSESKKFVKGFKKNKEELSAYLFAMFNRTVFDSKLPSDMSLTWNKRLLRTAGYCAYKKNVKNPEDRTARIELSTKVCDTAERTRDTLIHEMCHAAVWLLNGVNGGHGPYWKYWARHATRIHPELPSISRCHSYSINTKFTYRCKKCGYSIGRHSKSLDTKKKVCGYCRGEFELIHNSKPTTPSSASSASSSTVTTPRQPNKFALFVKENYNSVKKRKQDLKHGDVMKELSKMFAESKISS